MARGHERSAVFRDDGHRERFLGLLGSVSKDEAWEIHGYCLMGNHYHLLVETPWGSFREGSRLSTGGTRSGSTGGTGGGDTFGSLGSRSVLVQREGHLLELHHNLQVRGGGPRAFPPGWRRSRQEIAPIATKGCSGEVGCTPSKPEDKGASLLDRIPTIYPRAECRVRWFRRKWITASPYGPSLENLE